MQIYMVKLSPNIINFEAHSINLQFNKRLGNQTSQADPHTDNSWKRSVIRRFGAHNYSCAFILKWQRMIFYKLVAVMQAPPLDNHIPNLNETRGQLIHLMEHRTICNRCRPPSSSLSPSSSSPSSSPPPPHSSSPRPPGSAPCKILGQE